MVANAIPIFPNAGIFAASPNLTTGNTTKDGAGLTVAAHFLFQSPVDGMLWDRIRFTPRGANVATLARLFYTTDASGDLVAGVQTQFWDNFALPATAVNEVSGDLVREFPMGLLVPPSVRWFVCVATTVAAGWSVQVVGGRY